MSQVVFLGLVNGATYAMIAVGLTIIYGTLRILHIAHASVVALGAYAMLVLTDASGSAALGLAGAMLLGALAGSMVYLLFYQAIERTSHANVVVVSIGLLIVSQELLRLAFGPYGLSYRNPALQDMAPMLDTAVSHGQLAMVAACAVSFLFLYWLGRTRLGLASRAVVDDLEMAASSAVPPRTIKLFLFALGSALAACAGGILGAASNLVEPTTGLPESFKALAIIVASGLGNVRGALALSLFVGVAEAIWSAQVGSVLDRDAFSFLLLLAILLFRPRGLFSGR